MFLLRIGVKEKRPGPMNSERPPGPGNCKIAAHQEMKTMKRPNTSLSAFLRFALGPNKTRILILGIVLLFSSNLMAQKRIYRSSQPVGKFIPALIDAMTESGMRFSVEKAYDEKSDGKLGLLIMMKPGGRVVDMASLCRPYPLSTKWISPSPLPPCVSRPDH